MTNTQDSYTNIMPCRFERYLSKVSVRSCDASNQGGSGDYGPPRITQGEGAAALAGLRVPEVRGLIDWHLAADGADGLLRYKYLGHKKGRHDVFAAGMMIASSLALQGKWKLEPRGSLQNCVNVAIDDICAPVPYVLSIREWTGKIGLENHMQWQRGWSEKYRDIRYYIQALELAAIDYIRRAG